MTNDITENDQLIPSGTPLADVLAEVGRIQALRPDQMPASYIVAAELSELRHLAEAVRASLARRPEIDAICIESTAAELWDNMSEDDRAGAARSYLSERQVGMLEKLSAEYGEPAAPYDQDSCNRVAAQLIDAGVSAELAEAWLAEACAAGHMSARLPGGQTALVTFEKDGKFTFAYLLSFKGWA